MCRLLVFLRYVRHIVPSGEAADMIAMTIICLMTRCVTVYVKKTFQGNRLLPVILNNFVCSI